MKCLLTVTETDCAPIVDTTRAIVDTTRALAATAHTSAAWSRANAESSVAHHWTSWSTASTDAGAAKLPEQLTSALVTFNEMLEFIDRMLLKHSDRAAAQGQPVGGPARGSLWLCCHAAWTLPKAQAFSLVEWFRA